MTTNSAKATSTVDDAAVAAGATKGEAAAMPTRGTKVGDIATTRATKATTGGTTGGPARNPTPRRKAPQRAAVADGEARSERKPRTGTRQAKLIAMLEAKDGATVAEIAAAFGWQAHTVRGALYGALKKKLGLDVTSEKVEGRGRVYRIGN